MGCHCFIRVKVGLDLNVGIKQICLHTFWVINRAVKESDSTIIQLDAYRQENTSDFGSTGAHADMVCAKTVLLTPECLYDFSERKYRHRAAQKYMQDIAP